MLVCDMLVNERTENVKKKTELKNEGIRAQRIGFTVFFGLKNEKKNVREFWHGFSLLSLRTSFPLTFH